MKNIQKVLSRLIVAATVAIFFSIVVSNVSAYPRTGGGTAQSVVQDDGNTMSVYNISLGTGIATAVYTKTSNRVDRRFRICNDQAATYYIVISTSSGVSGTATRDVRAHDLVLPATCNDYISPSQTLYGVFQSSSTSGSFTGGRAFGWKRYDSRD